MEGNVGSIEMDFDMDMDMDMDLFGDDFLSVGPDAFAESASIHDSTLQQQQQMSGLLNQGATCYLNSLLQALFMTPEFRAGLFSLTPKHLVVRVEKEDEGAPLPEGAAALLEMGFREEAARAAFERFPGDEERRVEFLLSNPEAQRQGETRERVLPRELQRLFARLQERVADALSTKELTECFGAGFSAGVQHDVHELNRILFDRIEKQLRGTPVPHLIDRLYRGSTVSRIECQSCGYRSEREESFLDISVVIQRFSGIQESLQSYVQDERLDGDNQYMCSGCEKKVDALRGVRIKSLPPVLILCLSRFEYDTTTWERIKNMREFSFPFELDMTPYCDQQQQQQDYELFGVVIHAGRQAGHGHYHAYLRDVLSEEEHWFDFNDSRVTPIPRKKILSQYGGDHESAYMLVYRKRGLLIEPPVLPAHLARLVEEEAAEARAARQRAEDARHTHRYRVFSGQNFVVQDVGIARLQGAAQSFAFDSRLPFEDFCAHARSLLELDDEEGEVHDIQVRDRRLKFLGRAKSMASLSPERAVLFWDGKHLASGAPFEIVWQASFLNIACYPGPNVFDVACPPQCTLGDLRVMLTQRTGLDESMWLFQWGRKQATLLERGKDALFLRQLRIKDGARLSCEAPRRDGNVLQSQSCASVHHSPTERGGDTTQFSIFVTNQGDETHLASAVRVHSGISVLELKHTIIQEIGTLNEDKPMRLRRSLAGGMAGELFGDEMCKLKAAGVSDNDRVILEYGDPPGAEDFTVSFVWGTSAGGKLTTEETAISVTRSMTVLELKNTIMGLLNLNSDPCTHRLRRTDFWGQQGAIFVDESATLRSLRISENEAVWLEEGVVPKPGHVELQVRRKVFKQNGLELWDFEDLMAVQVRKKSTIRELKVRLLAEVEAADIRIWFGDTLLSGQEEKTLKSAGIHSSGNLDLEFLEQPDVDLSACVILWLVQRKDGANLPASCALLPKESKQAVTKEHLVSFLRHHLTLSADQHMVCTRRINHTGKFRIVIDEQQLQATEMIDMQKENGMQALRNMRKQQGGNKVILAHGDLIVWRLSEDSELESLVSVLNPVAGATRYTQSTQHTRPRVQERGLQIEDDEFWT